MLDEDELDIDQIKSIDEYVAEEDKDELDGEDPYEEGRMPSLFDDDISDVEEE